MRPARKRQTHTRVSQVPLHAVPREQLNPAAKRGSADVQKGVVTNSMPSFQQNFEGVGNLNFVLPPDTQGDVGPNNYVQMINLSFAIWDKQGNLLYGPVPNTTPVATANARSLTPRDPEVHLQGFVAHGVVVRCCVYPVRPARDSWPSQD